MSHSKKQDEGIIFPWRAYTARTERISIQDANGRQSASTIRQYPPGIPDVIPGMDFSDDIINAIKSAHASKVDIIGVNMSAEQKIDVVLKSNRKTDEFSIQTFLSHEIDDKLAIEIADYFRISFSAAPYFHFAFHESNPLQSLPHTLDFPAYIVSIALSDPMKRMAAQQSLREMAYRKAKTSDMDVNFESIDLPNGFHHWTDKTLCRTEIKNRLSDPGYVTLIRQTKTNKLKGLLHSRMGTLERIFQSEEWSNPHLFSAFNTQKLENEDELFFEKIQYHFGLSKHDPIMTISAQILSEDAKGGDVFYDMMRSMAPYVTPEHARLPVLSEIPPFGTAHTLNTALNDRLVFGVLKNDHPLVFCCQFSQGIFPIISEKKHWQHLLRKAALQKRHYQKNYFVPLSTDNENVIVKPNGKLGLAVFATADIPTQSRIAIFTGETYKSDTALGLPTIMRDHAIQIGPDEFVFGHKGLAHCVCHSCDPNCGIRGLTEIFAIRDITKGEQITWDYRCSENSNWVLESCLCGSVRCTGTVGNHDSLPEKFRLEYLEKGMVSDWLTPS